MVRPVILPGASLQLLNGWQRDFPLVPQPFRDRGPAARAAASPACWSGCASLRERGVLGRIGAVWNAGAGGAAALCALAVPPERAGRGGRQASAKSPASTTTTSASTTGISGSC